MSEARSALQTRDAVHWAPVEGAPGHEEPDSGSDCAYELWVSKNPATGDPWMFCEEDYFLGRTFEAFHPQTDPFCSASGEKCAKDAVCPLDGESCLDSNKKTLAFVRRLTYSAQFGPADKPLKAQAMTRTPTKHVHDPARGDVIWFQSGFIVHRKPHLYRSVVQDSVDGILQSEGTAWVEVVSHEEHLRRAANGTWKPAGIPQPPANPPDPVVPAPIVDPTAAPPQLVGIVSRKQHGAAGTFDLPIAGSSNVEPRRGPSHTIVFTFDKPVIAGKTRVSLGTAAAGPPTFSGSEMRVPLIGVADKQWVTITVSDVASADGGTGGGGAARLGFLLGDVERRSDIAFDLLRIYTIVDDLDWFRVNASLAQVVTTRNFQYDVDTSGTISPDDVMIVRSRAWKWLLRVGSTR